MGGIFSGNWVKLKNRDEKGTRSHTGSEEMNMAKALMAPA